MHGARPKISRERGSQLDGVEAADGAIPSAQRL